MNIETISLPSFSVIGLEGSTQDGDGFISRLWERANALFPDVQPLAKTTESGQPVGVWGLMTDFSRSFLPWSEGFTHGLYLAGVECSNEVLPPEGWVKWTVPAFEYLRAECEEGLFDKMLAYLAENSLTLSGAVHDFTDPSSGKSYMLFPIRRL